MIEVTGVLQKQAWDLHVMPPVELVRPGLWSIPVPIPNNPLRYVLVYALELDDGVAIVDAGWNTDDAWAALNSGLEEAGGSINDVQAVLVTHIHPDHYGLAGRVRERVGGVDRAAPRRREHATQRVTWTWTTCSPRCTSSSSSQASPKRRCLTSTWPR